MRQLICIFIVALSITSCDVKTSVSYSNTDSTEKEQLFTPPDTATIPYDDFGNMVRYGRELVVNTAYYIGPEGTVGKHLNNKMNCSNCHLDGGTRPFALNYFSSHARYPQYRGRENKILSLADRVNNCIERPHHGKPLPLDSKEMLAIVSYMKWLAEDVPTGHRVKGDDGLELNYPARAANPDKGAVIYAAHCASCHGANGEGVMRPDNITYSYPPLWGMQSYEAGSSMHRVLKAARFIKANMPDKKAFWHKPFLSDNEAIDVAAFINDDRIHQRPQPTKSMGYENISVKPIDYGVGPYVDTFSELQHKFGPYQPIIDYHKNNNLPIVF